MHALSPTYVAPSTLSGTTTERSVEQEFTRKINIPALRQSAATTRIRARCNIKSRIGYRFSAEPSPTKNDEVFALFHKKRETSQNRAFCWNKSACQFS